jgi:hypothetical protein
MSFVSPLPPPHVGLGMKHAVKVERGGGEGVGNEKTEEHARDTPTTYMGHEFIIIPLVGRTALTVDRTPPPVSQGRSLPRISWLVTLQ